MTRATLALACLLAAAPAAAQVRIENGKVTRPGSNAPSAHW
jgi:hypothetical protein